MLHRTFRIERRYVVPTILPMMFGLLVLLYRGPGRAIVRGHVGDVLVVACLYFLLGIFLSIRPSTRALSVGVFALGTELYQLLVVRSGPQSTLHALTIGAYADPFDLLAYLLGLFVAVWIDVKFLAERAAPSTVAQR